ncbi:MULTISPECIES: adaptor protein MecA [unclassified Jeotgalibaca]|uniref:adaptor protein MecA n=1 Tax=unclassified Jeotgalibaca TaxID=2621505 RepID=UPI003FCF161C
MEMENVNENTIRVVIESSDLEERGITFLDLLGNQKQIESFFYSILEEVDVDNQFLETDAITFQVLPKGSGLELFISKGDTDEIDTFDEDDFDPTEHILDIMNQHTENISEDKTEPLLEENELGILDMMIKFNEFEDFIEASKRFYLESGNSTLYHYQDAYYLAIDFFIEEMTETNLETQIAVILEFGEESSISAEVLGEYGKLIMHKDALESARHYFK